MGGRHNMGLPAWDFTQGNTDASLALQGCGHRVLPSPPPPNPLEPPSHGCTLWVQTHPIALCSPGCPRAPSSRRRGASCRSSPWLVLLAGPAAGFGTAGEGMVMKEG